MKNSKSFCFNIIKNNQIYNYNSLSKKQADILSNILLSESREAEKLCAIDDYGSIERILMLIDDYISLKYSDKEHEEKDDYELFNITRDITEIMISGINEYFQYDIEQLIEEGVKNETDYKTESR
jgi:hypothetical protein